MACLIQEVLDLLLLLRLLDLVTPDPIVSD
jgi:hypothetical protein